VKSEDQEEELLSSVYVTGLTAKKSSGSPGEKALVGGSDGVITLWEKGQWDDQDERIIVSREKESVDALALIPDGAGGFGKKVAAGLGDGKIRFIRLGENKVVGDLQHDEVEGVVSLGFDVGGRMISGGGQVVKVWDEHIEEIAAENSHDDVEDHDDIDDEDQSGVGDKRMAKDSDSDDGEDQRKASSEDEGEQHGKKKKKKRRKRDKGSATASTFNFAGLD
jgi:hypothetical protein